MDWALLGGILASIGGILLGLTQLLRVLRETPSRRVADGASIVSASGELVNMYRDTLTEVRTQMNELQKRVDELREEIDLDEDRMVILEGKLNRVRSILQVYRDGTHILIDQLMRLGYTPDWSPPALSDFDEDGHWLT